MTVMAATTGPVPAASSRPLTVHDREGMPEFELDERGNYQRVAEVSGDKAYEATQPFPVTIVPAELLGCFEVTPDRG